MTTNPNAEESLEEIYDSFDWAEFQRPYDIRYWQVARRVLESRVADGKWAEPDQSSARRAFKRAEKVLDDLFISVSYMPRTKADEKEVERFATQEDGEFRDYYFAWRHQSASKLQLNMRALSVDRQGLHLAVANYIKQPECNTDYIDWWCAETVCYQEIAAFAFNVNARSRVPGWLGGLSRKAKREKAHLLSEMLAVYQVLESGVFSWEVFWQELNRTRELGAVWPGELYRLVELRK